MCSRLEQQYKTAIYRAMEAEKEYEMLTGKVYGEEIYEEDEVA